MVRLFCLLAALISWSSHAEEAKECRPVTEQEIKDLEAFAVQVCPSSKSTALMLIVRDIALLALPSVPFLPTIARKFFPGGSRIHYLEAYVAAMSLALVPYTFNRERVQYFRFLDKLLAHPPPLGEVQKALAMIRNSCALEFVRHLLEAKIRDRDMYRLANRVTTPLARDLVIETATAHRTAQVASAGIAIEGEPALSLFRKLLPSNKPDNLLIHAAEVKTEGQRRRVEMFAQSDKVFKIDYRLLDRIADNEDDLPSEAEKTLDFFIQRKVEPPFAIGDITTEGQRRRFQYLAKQGTPKEAYDAALNIKEKEDYELPDGRKVSFAEALLKEIGEHTYPWFARHAVFAHLAEVENQYAYEAYKVLLGNYGALKDLFARKLSWPSINQIMGYSMALGMSALAVALFAKPRMEEQRVIARFYKDYRRYQGNLLKVDEARTRAEAAEMRRDAKLEASMEQETEALPLGNVQHSDEEKKHLPDEKLNWHEHEWLLATWKERDDAKARPSYDEKEYNDAALAYQEALIKLHGLDKADLEKKGGKIRPPVPQNSSFGLGDDTAGIWFTEAVSKMPYLIGIHVLFELGSFTKKLVDAYLGGKTEADQVFNVATQIKNPIALDLFSSTVRNDPSIVRSPEFYLIPHISTDKQKKRFLLVRRTKEPSFGWNVPLYFLAVSEDLTALDAAQNLYADLTFKRLVSTAGGRRFDWPPIAYTILANTQDKADLMQAMMERTKDSFFTSWLWRPGVMTVLSKIDNTFAKEAFLDLLKSKRRSAWKIDLKKIETIHSNGDLENFRNELALNKDSVRCTGDFGKDLEMLVSRRQAEGILSQKIANLIPRVKQAETCSVFVALLNTQAKLLWPESVYLSVLDVEQSSVFDYMERMIGLINETWTDAEKLQAFSIAHLLGKSSHPQKVLAELFGVADTLGVLWPAEAYFTALHLANSFQESAFLRVIDFAKQQEKGNFHFPFEQILTIDSVQSEAEFLNKHPAI